MVLTAAGWPQQEIAARLDQARVLTAVARAVAAAGDLDRAETVARSITHPYQQAESLAAVAGAVAAAGDLDRARQLADRAEAVARSITNPCS